MKIKAPVIYYNELEEGHLCRLDHCRGKCCKALRDFKHNERITSTK